MARVFHQTVCAVFGAEYLQAIPSVQISVNGVTPSVLWFPCISDIVRSASDQPKPYKQKPLKHPPGTLIGGNKSETDPIPSNPQSPAP